MGVIFTLLISIAALVIQVAVIPAVDILLLFLVAVLFFKDEKTALFLSFPTGYLLDLYSPLFGVHLIVYPLVVVIASLLSQRLFTDQSILSFGVLAIGSFLLVGVLEEFLFWTSSVFQLVPGGLPILHSLRLYGIALAFHLIGTLFFYFIGSVISRRFRVRYAQ